MPDFKLPQVLDQRGAQTVSARLLDQLGQALSLDASDIRRLGAVGVEMLISAQRQWQADDVPFEVRDWSPEALKSLATLGVDPHALRVEGPR